MVSLLMLIYITQPQWINGPSWVYIEYKKQKKALKKVHQNDCEYHFFYLSEYVYVL